MKTKAGKYKIEAQPHTIEPRILKLLKETQTLIHRPGVTSQAAIKGFFALRDCVMATNGRMVVYVFCEHGLPIDKQYYFNGNSIFPTRYSGFVPIQFSQLNSTIYTHYIKPEDLKEPTMASFLWFCFKVGVCPDVTESSRILDIIYQDFRKDRIYFLANSIDKEAPIGVRVSGVGFNVCIYCLPVVDLDLTIVNETVSFS